MIMSAQKGIPLTKDEVMQLVKLVEANPVVFSKPTNARNNQLKEAAWSKITDLFNEIISSCPRKPEQLRLKWENLKKAARKRSSKIKTNSLKTEGKPDYIPPDDALDKVAALLGSTCNGDNVQFGSDAVKEAMEEVEEFEDVRDSFQGKLDCQAVEDDVKESIIERNRAITQYYDAKRRNELDLFTLQKRNLELDILEREKFIPGKLKNQAVADAGVKTSTTDTNQPTIQPTP